MQKWYCILRTRFFFYSQFWDENGQNVKCTHSFIPHSYSGMDRMPFHRSAPRGRMNRMLRMHSVPKILIPELWIKKRALSLLIYFICWVTLSKKPHVKFSPIWRYFRNFYGEIGNFDKTIPRYLTIIPWARVVHELIANEARSAELAINSLLQERVE